MNHPDPYRLFFEGMQKLGPGSDADTKQVLSLLPSKSYSQVIDVGCGTGRQTFVLASQLQQTIQAIDNHPYFLQELDRRAAELGLTSFVKTHCLDMAALGDHFQDLELLWCEGAAYHIGFERALREWRDVLAPAGWLVVSELCWLDPKPPESVTAFFAAAYPSMKSVDDNLELISRAGYRCLHTHRLPQSAWEDGYYDLLEERGQRLLTHDSETVRDLASETLQEIEVFRKSAGSYGYVFFVLQK